MKADRETQVIVLILLLTLAAFGIGINIGLERAQHQRCQAGYVEACKPPVTR